MDESQEKWEARSAENSTPRPKALVPEAVTRSDRIYLDAFEPSTGKIAPGSVAITKRRASSLAKVSLGKVVEIQKTVPFALRWPVAVFCGLRCDEDEKFSDTDGWRCYVATPPQVVAADGQSYPAAQSDVFLVFVNSEGVAYNWRWEAADEQDDHLPRKHSERFRKCEYHEHTKP